jgi:mono/diheme cytochrome c family protein
LLLSKSSQQQEQEKKMDTQLDSATAGVRLAKVLTLGLVLAGLAAPLMADDTQAAKIERGRYLAIITGCNDCHTAGYGMAEGKIPESEWLKGDAFGWSGPWGTTYAPNLRLSLSKMTEDQWVVFAKNLRSRPPMPSVNLNAMKESDMRDLYAFITHLQPLGEPAPAYLPPGEVPTGPHVVFPSPPPSE